jgi:hypothetical protein
VNKVTPGTGQLPIGTAPLPATPAAPTPVAPAAPAGGAGATDALSARGGAPADPLPGANPADADAALAALGDETSMLEEAITTADTSKDTVEVTRDTVEAVVKKAKGIKEADVPEVARAPDTTLGRAKTGGSAAINLGAGVFTVLGGVDSLESAERKAAEGDSLGALTDATAGILGVTSGGMRTVVGGAQAVSVLGSETAAGLASHLGPVANRLGGAASIFNGAVEIIDGLMGDPPDFEEAGVGALNLIGGVLVFIPGCQVLGGLVQTGVAIYENWDTIVNFADEALDDIEAFADDIDEFFDDLF